MPSIAETIIRSGDLPDDGRMLWTQMGLYAIAGIVLMYFEIMMSSARPRGKHMNKEYMEQFQEECRRTTGHDVPMSLDQGNGHFSKNLSYKAWYEINNAKRSHENILETIFPCVFLIAVSLVNNPCMGTICAWVYIFARLIYAIGYKFMGPSARIPGGLIFLMLIPVLFGAACASIAMWDCAKTIGF